MAATVNVTLPVELPTPERVEAMLREELAKVAAQALEEMTGEEAAALIGCDVSTLRRNHVEWGIDKLIGCGREYPKYPRSQVRAAIASKRIKGRKRQDEGSSPHSNSPKLSVLKSAA